MLVKLSLTWGGGGGVNVLTLFKQQKLCTSLCLRAHSHLKAHQKLIIWKGVLEFQDYLLNFSPVLSYRLNPIYTNHNFRRRIDINCSRHTNHKSWPLELNKTLLKIFCYELPTEISYHLRQSRKLSVF